VNLTAVSSSAPPTPRAKHSRCGSVSGAGFGAGRRNGRGMSADEAMRDTVFGSSFRCSRPRPSGLMGSRRGRGRPASTAVATALDRVQRCSKWRRRESKPGPVIIAENVGAIRSADSGEESGACGDTGGVANAPDDVGTSRACSSVASRTMPAALLAAIDAAIVALDAGRPTSPGHGCTRWRRPSGPNVCRGRTWRLSQHETQRNRSHSGHRGSAA
jgi:hypothetical protein